MKNEESKIEESCTIQNVRLSLPSQNEIDEQIDSYAFRVPYDGSTNFYDEVALKHYKAGIEWLLKQIKGNSIQRFRYGIGCHSNYYNDY